MEYNCRSYCVSVLLASACAATLNRLKAHFEGRHKYNCFIWECVDLADSFADQAACHPDIDIVLVDFSLIDAQRPHEIFQKMATTLNNATIIVFNNAKGQGFALSSTGDDHPDGISAEEWMEDEFNLYGLIERCLTRVQDHRRRQMRSIQQMAEIRRQWPSGGWTGNGDAHARTTH